MVWVSESSYSRGRQLVVDEGPRDLRLALVAGGDGDLRLALGIDLPARRSPGMRRCACASPRNVEQVRGRAAQGSDQQGPRRWRPSRWPDQSGSLCSRASSPRWVAVGQDAVGLPWLAVLPGERSAPSGRAR